MELSNYYFLLNVDEDATTQDIIKSYRNLCRLAKTNNIIKTYINQIKMAYLVLTNPTTRKEYDNQIKQVTEIETIDSDYELYSDYKQDDIKDESLKDIDKEIHKEINNIENIKELRDKELDLLTKNYKK